MEFQVEIKYEDEGYDLEIYPFNGNSISSSFFEGKSNLTEVIEVIDRFFESINMKDNNVQYSSNYNTEKRRAVNLSAIKNYIYEDFINQND